MGSTAIHKHGRELIATSEIAAILNEYFNLPSDTRIDYNLPYMWWYRSKLNHLAHPMPAPTITTSKGVPWWEQEAILHWFGDWKEIEVPESRASGDYVDDAGGRRVSEYRSAQ